MADRSARKHWKGGLFYFNPQDPDLYIPKRHGRGVTLNFAHREAWVVLGTVLGVMLSLPLLIVILVAVAVRVQ